VPIALATTLAPAAQVQPAHAEPARPASAAATARAARGCCSDAEAAAPTAAVVLGSSLALARVGPDGRRTTADARMASDLWRHAVPTLATLPDGTIAVPPRRVDPAACPVGFGVAGDTVAWADVPPVGLPQVRVAPLP